MVLLMSVDSSSGHEALASAEFRNRIQDSISELVTSVAADERFGRRWVLPLAATAAVAAAAVAPVVWPLLLAAGGGAGATAVASALSQVGGVGAGLLTEAIIR